MTAFASWQVVLTQLTVPAYFLLAAVMYSRKLVGAYRFFWCYLLVEGLAVSIFTLSNSRVVQSYVYAVVQPVLWLFYILVVLELYRKVLARFPGIATYLQRLIIVSLAITLALSFVLMDVGVGSGKFSSLVLQRYAGIHRSISTAVCLSLLVITAFLAWFPVPLPRNTVIHTILFFFYFLSTTVAYLYRSLTGQAVNGNMNAALQGMTLIALVGWISLLTSEGERSRAPAGSYSPAEASALLRGMETINSTLSRRTK